MAQQFTTVHTYRAPLTSGSTCGKGTRLFAGTPNTGYAVDTFATQLAMKGARVYRPANLNAAVLWVDDRSGGSAHLMLAPEALRELAGRLLDAAQDIEQNPAACKNLLKALITSPTKQSNPKNMPLREEKNHKKVVFLSNEITPVAFDPYDRWYSVAMKGGAA